MTPRTTRNVVVPTRRGTSPLAPQAHHQRLERLEGRTLFAAAVTAEATEAFLIGGEVVSTPAVVETSMAATGSAAGIGQAFVGVQMPATRIGFLATGSAAFGRVVMVRVADGVRYGMPPAPAGSADGDVGDGSDASPVRRAAGPQRLVPPVTQASTLANAREDDAAEARTSSDAAALAAARTSVDAQAAAPGVAARADGAGAEDLTDPE